MNFSTKIQEFFWPSGFLRQIIFGMEKNQKWYDIDFK